MGLKERLSKIKDETNKFDLDAFKNFLSDGFKINPSNVKELQYEEDGIVLKYHSPTTIFVGKRCRMCEKINFHSAKVNSAHPTERMVQLHEILKRELLCECVIKQKPDQTRFVKFGF